MALDSLQAARQSQHHLAHVHLEYAYYQDVRNGPYPGCVGIKIVRRGDAFILLVKSDC